MSETCHKGAWHGLDLHEFEFNGRKCKMVRPDAPAPSRPWVWRAEYWDHEPQADIALVKKGFHVVFIDCTGMFGQPEHIKIWNDFYEMLVREHKLAEKCVLEGLSRGGLYSYKWAAANPDKVAAIYADAPVCNMKSWPFGGWVHEAKPSFQQQCLKAYGVSSLEEAEKVWKNPIDNLEPLAKAKIPILHVCGDIDDVVPISENSDIVEDRYKRLGGEIEVIMKKNCNHHPHSLKDPVPIVDFIVKHAQ